MLAQLGDAVLARFGIQVVAPLGGRLNQHYLVERRGERMVLRRWAASAAIEYELRLLEQVATLGWPVAPALGEPVTLAGAVWSLMPFLPGEPPSTDDPIAEQRARGRLLAAFHADMARIPHFGQRAGWRRCEEILSDTTLDQVLATHEQTRAEEVRVLRWHLERARARVADIPLHEMPGVIVHGDFTTWNLRFQVGRLSGLLDFELAHFDHRVGDFALSWRGKYDAVVAGYDEVSPLAPEEWALLTPLWWTQLIAGACHDLHNGTMDDGWTIKKLLQRSPLMGPDAAEYR